jgi:hypothetical protein
MDNHIAYALCKHIAKATQAYATTKALSKSLQSHRTKTLQTMEIKATTDRRPACNSGFASCGGQCLNSSAVFQFNFSAGLTVLCPEIPHERKSAKRYSQW